MHVDTNESRKKPEVPVLVITSNKTKERKMKQNCLGQEKLMSDILAMLCFCCPRDTRWRREGKSGIEGLMLRGDPGPS